MFNTRSNDILAVCLVWLGAFSLWSAPCQAHPQDEALILDIEQGQLVFDNSTMAAEKAAAEKRKAQRELNALNPWQRFYRYTLAGIEHIVPKGLDHILFILGLFFASSSLRSLLLQVTIFTLAHSVTLILAALKIVSLPAVIVEPLIALSIAYIAFENIRRKTLSSSRLWLIFGFGLLHGLGFASVLAEYGLPNQAYLSALLAFNVGVELGQLLVLIVAAALYTWFRQQSYYRKWIQIPHSALIGAIGSFWFIQRLFFA